MMRACTAGEDASSLIRSLHPLPGRSSAITRKRFDSGSPSAAMVSPEEPDAP